MLRAAATGCVAAVLVVTGACGGGDDDATPSTSTTTTTTVSSTTSRPPNPTVGQEEQDAGLGRARLRGTATLDGEPFDTRFVGAVVRDDGLLTPCQGSLPPIEDGSFTLTVVAEQESAGCGAPGREVILWIYVDDQKHFAAAPLAWSGPGEERVDVAFSRTDATGAATSVTELNGEVFRDGVRVPTGTKVEAFVGDTRCGQASTRDTDGYEGYVLNVVGPDAVAGCTAGAPLRMVVDGVEVDETIPNDPGRSGTLDLTVP